MTGVYAIIKRWWWLLGIGAIVAALMGYLVASRLPDTYEARAQLLVGPLSADKDTLDAASAQARTYGALATTAPVLDATARRAGLTTVHGKIASVNASDVTRLIAITARDGDPVRAAAIANALAGVLAERAAAGPVAGRLTLVDRATPPDNPIGPSTGLIVALTAVVGLLGVFGIAALVDSLTNVMRSVDDLAPFAPVLGSVNGSPAWRREKPLVVEDDPDSPAAASYRVLTTKIQLSNGAGPLRSLLLVDVHGGRSSARVTANLAAGFAEDGTRVAVIDGDERAALMGVFTRGSESSDVVQRARPLRIGKLMYDRFRIRRPRIVVVRPRRTSEPIDLEQANETIERLLGGADLVLVTAGPADQSSETLIWARAVQMTVVVAEQDHTRREQITPTFESLRVADANVVGAVLS